MEVKEFYDVLSPPFFLFSNRIQMCSCREVFRGCVKEWPAITKWNPSNGGLDYLQALVGSSSVEAMLSRSGPSFYGDIKSHERVSLAFSSFVSYCKGSHAHLGETGNLDNSNARSEEEVPVNLDKACPPFREAFSRVYLAQPPLLGEKCLSSINFWMNNTHSRSSIHYDPHNNLLCIVTGCKTVCLWPPSVIPFLYPLPLYGESSNHSAVDIEHPDLSLHPRAKQSVNHSHKVTLAAGDALFIPEGRLKQILNGRYAESWNSEEKTPCQPCDGETGDAGFSSSREAKVPCTVDSSGSHNDLEMNQNACDRNLTWKDQQLEHEASQILCQLVSVVHEKVSVSSQGQLVYSDDSQNGTKCLIDEIPPECEPIGTSEIDSFSLENDPVACILRSVGPLILQRVFRIMVQSFPRTLEALVLHVLSPPAAEILTQKFDEMDKITTREEQY